MDIKIRKKNIQVKKLTPVKSFVIKKVLTKKHLSAYEYV